MDNYPYASNGWRKTGARWKKQARASSKTRGWGIYVLFNRGKIYYIGLTNRSIRSRIRHHTRHRHKGKWTHFSFYQVRRGKYTKDLETILLRIYKPPGNKLLGKFPRPKLNKVVE